MTKTKVKKGITIALAIATIVLVVWGIVVKVQQPSKGTQQLMSSNSSMENVIRAESTAPLTDEQFIYGTNNVIPPCVASPSAQRQMISQLYNRLSTVAGDNISCEFLNWFGQPGAIITIDEIDDVTLLEPLLAENADLKRVFINLRNKTTGYVVSEAVYAEGKILETFSIPSEVTAVDTAPVQSLLDTLASEFFIPAENVKYSGEYFIVNTSGMNAGYCLDVFDYVFRWFKQNHLETIVVFQNGTVLWASAKIENEAPMYERYRTNTELSPLFHMTYYYTCNFFKNDLQEQCKIYL